MKTRTLLTLLSAALVFSGFAASQSFHSLDADRDQIQLNTTIGLESEEGVNTWSLRYRMPEGSEINQINDSLGEIEDYSLESGLLQLKTNKGPKRTNETVKINYRINRDAEEIKQGLYTREISFSGFKDHETSGIVKAEDLISGDTNRGLQASFTDEMRFKGEGAANIVFNFGRGNTTEYYEFFNGSINSTDSYRVALGTVSLKPRFQKIPVALYSEDSSDLGFEWSAGLYRSGIIHMRKNDDKEKMVLTHETVHALSNDYLDWDRTRTSYIEEGIAKHAEKMMQKKLYSEGEIEERPGQLFGEEETYVQGGYRYTVPSRGDREKLWNYYSNDQDFMKNWSPEHEERSFGYAYGELIVKNYLMENGNISALYTEVDGSTTDSADEKWSRFSEVAELEPCNEETRERFESCLDDLNSHSFEVRAADYSGNDSIEVERMDLPERRLESTGLNRLIEQFYSLLDAFLKILEG